MFWLRRNGTLFFLKPIHPNLRKGIGFFGEHFGGVLTNVVDDLLGNFAVLCHEVEDDEAVLLSDNVFERGEIGDDLCTDVVFAAVFDGAWRCGKPEVIVGDPIAGFVQKDFVELRMAGDNDVVGGFVGGYVCIGGVPVGLRCVSVVRSLTEGLRVVRLEIVGAGGNEHAEACGEEEEKEYAKEHAFVQARVHVFGKRNSGDGREDKKDGSDVKKVAVVDDIGKE